MSLTFGDITQVAYVTRDLKKALAFFIETAGIGPWFVAEGRKFPNTTYRGTTFELEMSVGLANSGFIQLEIIQPLGTAKSMYTEWLDRHPSELLVQHLSSWPTRYQETHARALSKGYQVVMEGDTEQGAFVYFQHPDRPEFTFEMAELSESRRILFEKIRQAAVGWDGKDPIRGRP
jgi:hypothetical protein